MRKQKITLLFVKYNTTFIETKIIPLENEFILHIRYKNLAPQDELLKKTFSKQEYNAIMILEKKMESDKEVFYRIKIKPAALIRLKKFLDTNLEFQSIELFEYRLW